jgi:hypothetical protein
VTLERWPLGEASDGLPGERDLALRVTTTGAFRLLHRAAPMPCGARPACATFRHSDVDNARLQRLSRPALAAEEVCPWPLPGVVETGGRTYYGLCAIIDGAPRTTLYLLQPEPQYAQADPSLQGCQPLGLLTLGGVADSRAGVLFAADCPSGREAVRMGAPGVSPEPAGPISPPSCGADAPHLRVGAARVPLTTGRDRLEGFVPEALAPAMSRVVWTGDAFLVAQRVYGVLILRAASCRDAAG